MSFKVVVTDYTYPNTNPEREVFKGHDIELVDYKGKIETEEQLMDATRDADAVIVQFHKITKRVIDNLQNCKLIIRYAIGFDNIDIEAARARKIPVANVPDYCIDEVSTHAISLMLAITRKVHLMDTRSREGKLRFEQTVSVKNTHDTTLGIFGSGRIGTEVARKMQNFGYKRIIYFDPYIDNNPHAEKVDLDTFLAESDIISIHAPANAETADFFNKELFKRMKKGVYLINTARGALIDDDALEWALKEEIVGGAGLDVFHSEGTDGFARFLPYESVVITPHMAWFSEQSFMVLQRKVGEDVVRTLTEGKPKNWVNPF